ncbi:MAG TPA: prepilin-type N-terminal cleavage/methylation domain-containing protein [Verrucomicrobiae bacterium]|nr:prepilin-type N-terminal cleavage/methylation domain-containing protein [Verrucomicrobiae bacterium]
MMNLCVPISTFTDNLPGPPRRAPRKSGAAFTLFELLVVIAVLAVLLATLLPALARQQGPAQRTVCGDNLRRLMQATTMYATDSRDYLPEPNWNAPWTRRGWLYDARGGSVPNLALAPYNVNPQLAYEGNGTPNNQGGLLWPYLKDMAGYRCPLDLTNNAAWLSRANKLSSYNMNGAVCGYGTISGNSWRLSQFKPSAFCFVQGLELLSFAWNDGAALPDEGGSRVHSPMTPVGTFGGAVDWWSIVNYNKEATFPGANLAWCNPGSANGH